MTIETKVFRRLFVMYSIIIFVSVFSLSVFFINKTIINVRDQQQYLSRKILEDTNAYINSQIDSTKVQMNLLYRSNQEIDDILFYLNNDIQTYLENKLDNFYRSDKVTYRGLNSFIEECYANNTNIENIGLVSFKKNLINIYDKQGYTNSFNIIDNKSQPIQWEEAENEIIEVLRRKTNNKSSCFYSVNNVLNPYNLEKVGLIIVTYNMKELDSIYQRYNLHENELVITSNKGEVIYNSSQKYIGEKYPYFERIGSDRRSIYLDKPSFVDLKLNSAGLVILSIIPESSMLHKSKLLIITIIAIVIVLIIIAESIVYLKIKKLEKRTLNIVKAIDKVKGGNFKTKIPQEKDDDEISLIAESFNDMCSTLNEYINQVYVSEIKQKNAEMSMLQSQINPHFLYNTLESIRMKAIINGDKEIGRMLYNLATLFRSIVKAENVITIRQEVEYCRMYLDLYKFRYEDRFEYCLDFDNQILNKQIIKFTLQPIVENFLVHGIDLGANYNFMLITGEKINGNINITIEDNGKGLTSDEIAKLNEKIKSCSETKNSIGLSNVHERIVLLYGNEYGLRVAKGESQGLKVIITIPDKEVE